MADIRRYPFIRHLHSEISLHVLRYRRGKLVKSGRGLSFFFRPMNTSIAEVPVDNRDLPFLFHGRSRDFQDVTVQGSITFRVVDAEVLGQRLDFSIDLASGHYRKAPLDQLADLLTGMAQEIASKHLAESDIRPLLGQGLGPIQSTIEMGLRSAPALEAMGLELVSVRVSDMSPTTELEQALQTPTRESLQQEADKATFERRALAVERERAIAENELQNQIELAKRQERLIEQQGQNERRQAQENAEARMIEAKAQAERTEVEAEAQAGRIRTVDGAKVEAERERMAIYRDLPSSVLVGLAAQQLAGKLHTIEHLNVTPELLGPLLNDLVHAGIEKLQSPNEE
jgi:regulator of protease activity HflC (stomatin/prohibitin superfamily)